jgi:hypothetical protein
MPQWINMPNRASRHHAMRASCCSFVSVEVRMLAGTELWGGASLDAAKIGAARSKVDTRIVGVFIEGKKEVGARRGMRT